MGNKYWDTQKSSKEREVHSISPMKTAIFKCVLLNSLELLLKAERELLSLSFCSAGAGKCGGLKKFRVIFHFFSFKGERINYNEITSQKNLFDVFSFSRVAQNVKGKITYICEPLNLFHSNWPPKLFRHTESELRAINFYLWLILISFGGMDMTVSWNKFMMKNSAAKKSGTKVIFHFPPRFNFCALLCES